MQYYVLYMLYHSAITNYHIISSTVIYCHLLSSNVVFQNVLYTMGQLAGEFPEVVDDLSSRLKDAELRIPARPPNKLGAAVRSTASRGGVNGGNSVSSRPGTSGSDGGSIRSQKSMGNVSGMNSVQMKEFVPEF